MMVVDIADTDAVGRVHGQIFGESPPVATLVTVAALVDPDLLVEVELDAVRSHR
jgi:enamine deaminase RidA (YjgF/YER057c/UK114 family)